MYYLNIKLDIAFNNDNNYIFYISRNEYIYLFLW